MKSKKIKSEYKWSGLILIVVGIIPIASMFLLNWWLGLIWFFIALATAKPESNNE